MPGSIADELKAIAAEFRGDEVSYPVLLKRICMNYGIRVVRRNTVSPGKAFLEWNRAAGELPVVLLPMQKSSNWVRFCAAHELGHFALISRYDWHPEETSSYWQTEVMCDYFARELLLPDSLFCGFEIDDPRSAMDKCNSIMRDALVPWAQVAKKITQRDPNVVFMRLQMSKNDSRSEVISTSLPLEKGRRTRVNTRARFSSIAMTALEVARQSSMPERLVLTRDDFVGSRLGELFSELAVRKIFMETSASVDQIKLAATR